MISTALRNRYVSWAWKAATGEKKNHLRLSTIQGKQLLRLRIMYRCSICNTQLK